MLVLSRRQNESVVLPDLGVTIEVVRVQGNKVRLGIKAPDSIRILRSELQAIVSEFETFDSVAPEHASPSIN